MSGRRLSSFLQIEREGIQFRDTRWCLLCSFFYGEGVYAGGGEAVEEEASSWRFVGTFLWATREEIKASAELTGQARSRPALRGAFALITVQPSKVMVNSSRLWSRSFLSASVFISVFSRCASLLLRLRLPPYPLCPHPAATERLSVLFLLPPCGFPVGSWPYFFLVMCCVTVSNNSLGLFFMSLMMLDFSILLAMCLSNHFKCFAADFWLSFHVSQKPQNQVKKDILYG